MSFQVGEMGEDEDGNGNGNAAGTGTRTGWADLNSKDASFMFGNFSFGRVWNLCGDLWPQLDYSQWSTERLFEYPFPANWSAGSWFGVDTGLQTSQGSLGLRVGTIPSSACLVLPSLVLICLFKQLFWGQPVKNRNPSAKRTGYRVEWEDLPKDIQEHVVGRLPYEQVCQLKAVSKTLKECIERDEFLTLICELDLDIVILTPLYLYTRAGVLQCAGYDSSLKKWRRLPPLDYLPDYCAPDPDLFKEYLVCTQGGIVCINVSKSTDEKLIVFNPLTGKWKLLPPLNHRRNPVLMHLIVDAATQSFQVIVAGSSKSGDEHLSRITEVFDSLTWTWTRTGNLPGPDYGLNDYQSGVYKDGYLYCVAFLEQDSGRGILRYNLNKGIWLKHWTYPLPFAINSTILQLVENRGEVYLFSEQENGEGAVEHCVDRLECNSSDHGVESWKLRNVVRNKKMGGRSLEIYPEYVCVGYSEHQLCIFNAIDHSGMVYDVKSFGKAEVLEAPTGKGFCGEGFYTLNPLTFAIQPSFRTKV